VNITASSSCSRELSASNVANLTDNSEFLSLNKPNQWVCYDFKGTNLHPTGYAIRSWANERRDKGVEIKNWVVEVSNDEETWEELDRHENDVQPPGTIRAHAVICRDSYGFIRVRQHRAGGIDNFLVLTAFEVFGSISPPFSSA
jgi:hypothetical protein